MCRQGRYLLVLLLYYFAHRPFFLLHSFLHSFYSSLYTHTEDDEVCSDEGQQLLLLSNFESRRGHSLLRPIHTKKNFFFEKNIKKRSQIWGREIDIYIKFTRICAPSPFLGIIQPRFSGLPQLVLDDQTKKKTEAVSRKKLLQTNLSYY